MGHEMKVSIIICFYERLTHLKFCLDGLLDESRFFDEVVISDDGSDATTVRQLKRLISRYPFPILHAWQPKNGFRLASARNNGVRLAHGSYLMFLDCDFLILPGTVEVHRKLARPGRFLTGQFKRLSESQTQDLFQKGIHGVNIEKLYRSLPDDNLKHDHFKFVTRTWRIRLGLASARKQTLGGGDFSLFRSDFESVNGFDENFIGWGEEDIDFGIRLAANRIYGRSLIRTTRVLHMWHPREKNSDDRRKGSNYAYLNRRHIDPVCEVGLKK